MTMYTATERAELLERFRAFEATLDRLSAQLGINERN